jgi:nitrate reductase beta subunit
MISSVLPELQKRVSEDLALSKQELQKDMKGSYKHLAEQAEHCKSFVPVTSKSSIHNSITVTQGSGAGFGEACTQASNITKLRNADTWDVRNLLCRTHSPLHTTSSRKSHSNLRQRHARSDIF